MPNIRQLCEYVGAKIPHKWKEFGRFVGVDEGNLAAIEFGRPDVNNGFAEVFNMWYNQMTSDYTWMKVAEALDSDDLDEKLLLKDLYTKLAKPAPGTFQAEYMYIIFACTQ